MKRHEKATLAILISLMLTFIGTGIFYYNPKPSVPYDSPWIKAMSVLSAEAGQYRPVDYEVIIVTNTAGGLTTAKYYTAATDKILADYAVCVLETAQIRIRYDGTVPTASVGTPIEVGQSFILDNFDQLRNFKRIRTGATSGNLHVNYFKFYKD